MSHGADFLEFIDREVAVRTEIGKHRVEQPQIACRRADLDEGSGDAVVARDDSCGCKEIDKYTQREENADENLEQNELLLRQLRMLERAGVHFLYLDFPLLVYDGVRRPTLEVFPVSSACEGVKGILLAVLFPLLIVS